MEKKNIKGNFIKSHDKEKIYLHIWDEVDNPKGVIQIFHGMAEHGARYDDFAKYLNKQGFIVYADDHRGHGKTAGSLDKVGYLGENGFDNIVKDEYYITAYLKKTYVGLPIYIFGHSFGSFIAQEYINRYSNEVNGIILCGSAYQKGVLVNIGSYIATVRSKFGHDKMRDKLLDKMAFGSYNNKFKESKSKFAWLSSDNEVVKEYENDPYCGEVFTTNFYNNLFKGFRGLYTANKNININKNIPLLIIAGRMDPVGSYGKGVTKLFNYYKDLELSDVTLKFYEEGRHEILNEKNNMEVYEDTVNWILCNNERTK